MSHRKNLIPAADVASSTFASSRLSITKSLERLEKSVGAPRITEKETPQEFPTLTDEQIASLRGRVLSQDEATTVLNAYETLRRRAFKSVIALQDEVLALKRRLGSTR